MHLHKSASSGNPIQINDSNQYELRLFSSFLTANNSEIVAGVASGARQPIQSALVLSENSKNKIANVLQTIIQDASASIRQSSMSSPRERIEMVALPPQHISPCAIQVQDASARDPMPNPRQSKSKNMPKNMTGSRNQCKMDRKIWPILVS